MILSEDNDVRFLFHCRKFFIFANKKQHYAATRKKIQNKTHP